MASVEEKKKFAFTIDSYVANTGLSYVEAIVEYCASIGMELDSAASLVNNNLKEKIEYQAMETRQIKTRIPRLIL